MNSRLASIFLSILMASVCAGSVAAVVLAVAPVSIDALVEILRAEDELRFDRTLIGLLKSKDAAVRKRAALAAGRIGDKAALQYLSALLLDDDDDIAAMAAFAIGEIESDESAGTIVNILKAASRADSVRASAIEAAGKIAGANAETEKSANLGKSILDALDHEYRKGPKKSRELVLLGITAVLRSKPVDGDKAIAQFLDSADGRVRADAANAIARLNSKAYNSELRLMLKNDDEPIARANAARALGGAKDETAADILLEAAVADKDQRVRTNAANALGAIGSKASGPKLLKRAKFLMDSHRKDAENTNLNELITIAGVLGRIMEGSNDIGAIEFLNRLRRTVGYRAPEVEIALMRVSPKTFTDQTLMTGGDWRVTASIAAAFGIAADLKKSREADHVRHYSELSLYLYLYRVSIGKQKPDMSYPAILRAYAKYETNGLPAFLREALLFDDVVIRETAAQLLGEQELPKQPDHVLENYFALRDAFQNSESDKLNDATLSSLDAIKKQYLLLKEHKDIQIDLLEPIKRAAYSPDYLVRRRAMSIAKEVGLTLRPASERVKFDEKGISRVKTADYVTALSRKKAKAILTTTKGKFEIELYPEAAPLTVHNFIELAKSGYFNGLAIHRVVPNFVVQDGDPRGDGSGGPGWHIRCEINQIPYERGTVGMALSGKDTGGSQWFVAHSPQPHLDGGYTVFGKVNEADMKVVDKLVRGDVIRKVEIVE